MTHDGIFVDPELLKAAEQLLQEATQVSIESKHAFKDCMGK